MAHTHGFDQVFANLDKYVADVLRVTEIAMGELMQKLERWAKEEHDWQNRTGNLRASIEGYIEEVTPYFVTGVLEATMEYAMFLEMAAAGKWSWMWPVIVNHEAEIRAWLAEVCIAVESASKNPQAQAQYEADKAQTRGSGRRLFT